MPTDGFDAVQLADRIRSGERRALAKAITLVESTLSLHQDQAQRLLEEILPDSGNSVRLGITGVPGVGKSTFVEAFGLYLLREGKSVAVLAVDPTSAKTGGSILGDKTRMPRLCAESRAFIRPSPSRGSLGGVASQTREAMLLCEAAGYDVLITETVGVGQSEVTVSSMVDFFLVLMLAGAGDELQGIKRGIMEFADAIAINKADGENVTAAKRAQAEYRGALRLLRGHDSWVPPVHCVSAIEERGMAEVWAMIGNHRSQLTESGELAAKRRSQQDAWFWAMVEDGLKRRFLGREDVKQLLRGLSSEMSASQITPSQAARRLLELLGG
ncbi:MAG: methylmalonyl Co-A mutase-associated GTPase MeaB [Polyangiaceae bacterium]|nr:methylmalonyl Co-A mutase-associated GTPase MeaB [Polyangiaceae bacterium]